MTLEDRLRDRLRSETAGLQPPGDLIDTLSRGHARRFKRARLTLAGGSLVATAIVAILLVGLLASPPPPQPLNAAEVLQRAKAADAAATGKIIHFRVTTDAMYNVYEVWALRSEHIGRGTSDSGSDHAIVSDSVVRAGRIETVNYVTRTVQTSDTANDDLVEVLMPPLVSDPAKWPLDPQVSVTRQGGEIHLAAPGREGPDDPSGSFDVVLDPQTYLPVRGTFMGTLKAEITWLDATPENRQQLTHAVPPDFQQR